MRRHKYIFIHSSSYSDSPVHLASGTPATVSQMTGVCPYFFRGFGSDRMWRLRASTSPHRSAAAWENSLDALQNALPSSNYLVRPPTTNVIVEDYPLSAFRSLRGRLYSLQTEEASFGGRNPEGFVPSFPTCLCLPSKKPYGNLAFSKYAIRIFIRGACWPSSRYHIFLFRS